MKILKYYFVYSKSDDYGKCRTELVYTTLKNAKEYYHHKEVTEEDIEILKNYFDIIDYEEEKERDSESRFY